MMTETMRYTITIPGRPVPKGRPRFSRSGHAYTPEKTRKYEELVAWCAKKDIPEPLKGDVAMDIMIYANGHWPDIDNICKALLDGMNGIAYDDDKQVAALMIQRKKDKDERVEITLWEVK